MTGHEQTLLSFGRRVRERRRARRLSVRALARAAEISPSYLSSIEAGRNPTTGRPPEPSVMVVERIARHLGLEIADLSPTATAGEACGHQDHVLLYALGPRDGVLEALRERFAARVDVWLYIADPRDDPAALPRAADVIAWRWTFGSDPYPDEFLVPSRIAVALEREVRRHEARLAGRRVGLVIADCSAVMKWMVNPESEIDFEPQWAERATSVVREVSGGPPSVNVCVYQHRDIEALSAKIDTLDSLLRLIASHGMVLVSDTKGVVLAGPPAVQAALQECRPPGIAASTWRTLAAAAAAGLASHRHGA